MAVVTKYDSIALDGYLNPASRDQREKGGSSMGAKVRNTVGTVEVASGDSVGSTYTLARIPSNARIMGASKLYWDDLGSSAAPEVNVGIYGVSKNLDDDADALLSAQSVASSGSANVPADIADYGEYAWKLAGASADPGGDVDIKVAIASAAPDAAGTITLELRYLMP